MAFKAPPGRGVACWLDQGPGQGDPAFLGRLELEGQWDYGRVVQEVRGRLPRPAAADQLVLTLAVINDNGQGPRAPAPSLLRLPLNANTNFAVLSRARTWERANIVVQVKPAPAAPPAELEGLGGGLGLDLGGGGGGGAARRERDRIFQALGSFRGGGSTSWSPKAPDAGSRFFTLTKGGGPAAAAGGPPAEERPKLLCKFCAYLREKGEEVSFHWCQDDRILTPTDLKRLPNFGYIQAPPG